MKYGELLCGKKLPLRLKGSVQELNKTSNSVLKVCA